MFLAPLSLFFVTCTALHDIRFKVLSYTIKICSVRDTANIWECSTFVQVDLPRVAHIYYLWCNKKKSLKLNLTWFFYWILKLFKFLSSPTCDSEHTHTHTLLNSFFSPGLDNNPQLSCQQCLTLNFCRVCLLCGEDVLLVTSSFTSC